MSQSTETEILTDLARTICERRDETAEKSYTKSLLQAGPQKCAKKFGEEAIEFALAVASEDEAQVVDEAADVLYHMLVALEARAVPLDRVLTTLAARAGTSGHVEKAARKASRAGGR